MSKDIKKESNGVGDDQVARMYPVLETSISVNSQPPAPSIEVPQAAVRYINHSRNPSSVSRNAVSFAAPPPNKPNAIDSVLKIIGLRTSYEKAQQKKICFVRIISTNHSQSLFCVLYLVSSHSFGCGRTRLEFMLFALCVSRMRARVCACCCECSTNVN